MTSDRKLGRISIREIKEGWSKETEFSEWLAEPENLQVLCDALGIELIDDVERESPVGPYRADIVGTMSDGRQVIIENQWGTTDHDHLGKIITYASGKDASVIIWIAERYDDEHSSAIEWLNNISNNRWFFLVLIELISIDDSIPAPNFKVIQRPNNYVQMRNSSNSEQDSVGYEFWKGFLEYANSSPALRKALVGVERRTPDTNSYYQFARGCHGFNLHVTLTVYRGIRKSTSVRIWIGDDKELYNHFLQSRSAIEGEIGEELIWQNKEENKSSSITLKHDIRDDESNESCYKWFEQNVPRMKEIFNRYANLYEREEARECTGSPSVCSSSKANPPADGGASCPTGRVWPSGSPARCCPSAATGPS